MNNFELNECIMAIDRRWPGQLTNVLAGDLRFALRCYEKKVAGEAIRQVRLESNWRVIPVGKIMEACKKRSPNAARPRSEISISWDIFIQDPKTGYFHQLHTAGNFTLDDALRAAEEMRGKHGDDWVVVKDVSVRDMVNSRSEIQLARMREEGFDFEQLKFWR